MPVFNKRILLTLLSAAIFVLIISCQEKKSHKNKKDKEQSSTENPLTTTTDTSINPSSAPTGGCDASLWKFVYNPERLNVLDTCKVVTGIIEESDANEDGDQHMLLKLDAGFEDLLTKRNMKKKQGNLVIEAVCMNNITEKKVGKTCEGYVNHVQIPKVGDHVRVTGSYVIDSHNGWAEIHPITRIEKIK